MASGNVLKNRKRFVSERLDSRHGEQILFGSLDGEAMVIADWWNMNERARRDRLSVRMNRTTMTLIPTNRRIVFYQARSGFMPDRMTEIPLDVLRDVSFEVYPEANHRGSRDIWALTTFVTDQYSEHPSVMFRTRITDLYTFNAERRVILPGICREAGVRLSDTTDYDMIASSGISELLTQNSEDMFQDMLANGEKPEERASHVDLPDPNAPVYDQGRRARRDDRRRRKGGKHRTADQQRNDDRDMSRDDRSDHHDDMGGYRNDGDGYRNDRQRPPQGQRRHRDDERRDRPDEYRQRPANQRERRR